VLRGPTVRSLLVPESARDSDLRSSHVHQDAKPKWWRDSRQSGQEVSPLKLMLVQLPVIKADWPAVCSAKTSGFRPCYWKPRCTWASQQGAMDPCSLTVFLWTAVTTGRRDLLLCYMLSLVLSYTKDFSWWRSCVRVLQNLSVSLWISGRGRGFGALIVIPLHWQTDRWQSVAPTMSTLLYLSELSYPIDAKWAWMKPRW
jgi:hypothetical protein